MSAARAQLLSFQFPSDQDGAQLARKPRIVSGILKNNYGYTQWQARQREQQIRVDSLDGSGVDESAVVAASQQNHNKEMSPPAAVAAANDDHSDHDRDDVDDEASSTTSSLDDAAVAIAATALEEQEGHGLEDGSVNRQHADLLDEDSLLVAPAAAKKKKQQKREKKQHHEQQQQQQQSERRKHASQQSAPHRVIPIAFPDDEATIVKRHEKQKQIADAAGQLVNDVSAFFNDSSLSNAAAGTPPPAPRSAAGASPGSPAVGSNSPPPSLRASSFGPAAGASPAAAAAAAAAAAEPEGEGGSVSTLSEDDFSYIVALIFLAYAKTGGSEASFLVANLGPPVLLQSPYVTEGGSNKAQKQFPDVVREVKETLLRESGPDPSQESIEMRSMLASAMEELRHDRTRSEPLLGNTAVVSASTLEMLGPRAMIQAFDIVWVIGGAPVVEDLDTVFHLSSESPHQQQQNRSSCMSSNKNPSRADFPRAVHQALSRRDMLSTNNNNKEGTATADGNPLLDTKPPNRQHPPIKCRVGEVTMFYNGEMYLPRSASLWMQVLQNAAASIFEKLLLFAGGAAFEMGGGSNENMKRSGSSALSMMSMRRSSNSSGSGPYSRGTTLTDIDVIDEEMMFRLQLQWQNSSLRREQYTTTSHQIFDRVVATGMHDPAKHDAIIEPRTNRHVSYAELQRSSKLVAAYLHHLFKNDQVPSTDFWGEEASVGLFLPRCADFYIMMLGCHRAGAAYISLDPDWPPERLIMILEDSAAGALVTYSSMAEKLEQLNYGGKIILLDKAWAEILSEENEARLDYFVSPTVPSTPAYYIYTSGSTGRPKGVCIEHVNLCTFVLSEVKLFGLSNRHRVIQGFSTSFDASVEEIWLAFASGSALVVVEKQTMQDADALSSLCAKHKVTVFSTVPSLLAMMDAKRVPMLELVISGAEALNKEVVEAWAPVEPRERQKIEEERRGKHNAERFDRETEDLLKISKKRKFVNSYGPTEATVACCAEFVTRPLRYEEGKARKTVTIGRAQPNYVAYIVDERLQLVPPGVPGELIMAGPAVARGYVNRPDLTAEKFLPCPFHPRFKRMYRTGDLCRFSTEGKIIFLGRIDAQVKLRGFRIETGEIESQLHEFPGGGVTTAVVVLRTDAGGEPYLCAYMVVSDELKANFSENAFRKHLSATLPKYMIPTRFAWVSEMPRTPAGKLNRKGFPPPPPPVVETDDAAGGAGAAGGAAKAAAPPSTENEKILFPLWKELVKNVKGVNDNFFEIGGHSLLAGKLASKIRTKGFDTNISYIFKYPTIKELAAALPEREGFAEEVFELPPPEFGEPGALRKFLFIIVQLLTMFIVYLMSPIFVLSMLSMYGFTAEFETVMKEAKIGQVDTWRVKDFVLESLVLGSLLSAASFAHLFVVCPLVKWIILWKVEEGRHWIWSGYYLRFWIVKTTCGIAPIWFLSGTVILNWAMRLFGAKVGSGVIYSTPSLNAETADLLEIGDDSTVGLETALLMAQVVDSVLVLRKIKIGDTTSIGTRCVVEGGAQIGDEVIISHLSLVRADDTVPSGQRWGGSPAKPSSVATAPSLEVVADLAGIELPELEDGEKQPTALRPSALLNLVLALMYVILYVVITAVLMAPLFASFLVLWEYHDAFFTEGRVYRTFILVFPAVPAGMIIFLMFYLHFFIILLRWICLPWDVKPGYYTASSYVFHSYWLFSMFNRLSLIFAHPVYGSMFTQFYLKAIGVKVGKRVEASNLFGYFPSLLTLEDETFVADFVAVGPPEIFRGIMRLGNVKLEKRSFAGNGAVVHGGTKLKSESLLGLLSCSRGDLPKGSTHIGSPAYRMERKAMAASENDTSRFNPTCFLYVRRFVWELARSIAPATVLSLSFIIAFLVARYAIVDIVGARDFLLVALVFVVTSMFVSVLFLVVAKWIVVGAERPAAHPLWSSGVWRGEFVVDLITVVGANGLMMLARGTQIIPWMFWLLGSKIENPSSVFIDTILFTEPSLITIGAGACIGDRVTMQCHLFEDRVQKLGKLQVGRRATLGPLSIVLYSAEIGDGCALSPLSLVMKGECFAAGTDWCGIPAQRDGRTSAANAMRVARGESTNMAPGPRRVLSSGSLLSSSSAAASGLPLPGGHHRRRRSSTDSTDEGSSLAFSMVSPTGGHGGSSAAVGADAVELQLMNRRRRESLHPDLLHTVLNPAALRPSGSLSTSMSMFPGGGQDHQQHHHHHLGVSMMQATQQSGLFRQQSMALGRSMSVAWDGEHIGIGGGAENNDAAYTAAPFSNYNYSSLDAVGQQPISGDLLTVGSTSGTFLPADRQQKSVKATANMQEDGAASMQSEESEGEYGFFERMRVEDSMALKGGVRRDSLLGAARAAAEEEEEERGEGGMPSELPTWKGVDVIAQQQNAENPLLYHSGRQHDPHSPSAVPRPGVSLKTWLQAKNASAVAAAAAAAATPASQQQHRQPSARPASTSAARHKFVSVHSPNDSPDGSGTFNQQEKKNEREKIGAVAEEAVAAAAAAEDKENHKDDGYLTFDERHGTDQQKPAVAAASSSSDAGAAEDIAENTPRNYESTAQGPAMQQAARVAASSVGKEEAGEGEEAEKKGSAKGGDDTERQQQQHEQENNANIHDNDDDGEKKNSRSAPSAAGADEMAVAAGSHSINSSLPEAAATVAPGPRALPEDAAGDSDDKKNGEQKHEMSENNPFGLPPVAQDPAQEASDKSNSFF